MTRWESTRENPVYPKDREERKLLFAPNYRVVVHLINKYKKQNRLTYQDIADRVGINRGRLFRYLTYENEMRANIMFALMHACEIEIMLNRILLTQNDMEDYLHRYDEKIKQSKETSRRLVEHWAKRKAKKAAEEMKKIKEGE